MIVRKLIVNDGRTERELLIVGTITVGRDPRCQLNDLDPLLSRRHAEFVSTRDGVTIRDLNSRNGILVNGEKVPEHTLKPGDQIQLGHLHLLYIEELAVKTAEEHSRSHATTATDIEIPTMAPVARPAPAHGGAAPPTDDRDATRAQAIKTATAVEDLDATRGPAPAPVSFDDTHAPTVVRQVSPAPASTPAEARVVADAAQIVTDASPSCHALLGARPETIVGGRLSDLLSRALTFVATGDGPQSLSLSIARATSGQTITVTFTAGQPTENPS
jgi:pSer/pThr/pTyr-binding forkhead associated (FHA) protein